MSEQPLFGSLSSGILAKWSCESSSHVSPAILRSMSYSLSTALWCCHKSPKRGVLCTLNCFHDPHWTLLSSGPRMPTGMPVEFIWSYPIGIATTLRRLAWTGLSYDRHQLVATLMRHPPWMFWLQPQHRHSRDWGRGHQNIGIQHASTRIGGHSHALRQEVPAAHTPNSAHVLPAARMCQHPCSPGAPLSILYSGRPMSMLPSVQMNL